jgi:hypothetical protein
MKKYLKAFLYTLLIGIAVMTLLAIISVTIYDIPEAHVYGWTSFICGYSYCYFTKIQKLKL